MNSDLSNLTRMFYTFSASISEKCIPNEQTYFFSTSISDLKNLDVDTTWQLAEQTDVSRTQLSAMVGCIVRKDQNRKYNFKRERLLYCGL